MDARTQRHRYPLAYVNEAVAAATRGGWKRLRLFAAVNRAVPLFVAFRFDEATAELDALADEISSGRVDMTTAFFQNLQCVALAFIDPQRARAAAIAQYDLTHTLFASAEATLLALAVATASAGDVDLTRTSSPKPSRTPGAPESTMASPTC